MKSAMKIKFLFILFLYSFSLLGQQELKANLDHLLSLPQGSEIPKDLAKSLFEVDYDLFDGRLNYEKILAKNDNYILLSYTSNCYAGGYCFGKYYTTFSSNGRRIDELPVEGGIADCSFSRDKNLIAVADLNIYINKIDIDTDCDTDSTLKEVIQVLEYRINPAGRFVNSRTQRINSSRQYKRCSYELYSEQELRSLSADQLATMRNEVFAAYGYAFKTKKWSEYFSKIDWYKPKRNAVSEDELLFVERKNIQLIKKLESQ